MHYAYIRIHCTEVINERKTANWIGGKAEDILWPRFIAGRTPEMSSPHRKMAAAARG
jgi:hypothetical protein